MTREPDADVVVVGLGVHGSASAYELAGRGRSVIGLDQFAAGHVHGSSHGRTRMIRRAYPSAVWQPLVDRAHAGWQRWETDAGRTLVHRTGGLFAHPGAPQLQGPDCVPVHDAAVRMPSLVLPDGYSAVFDPSAGVLRAADALDVAQAGARARGAELSFDEPVTGWEQTGDGVVVRTDRRQLRAQRLVLAPGAWVGGLVPELAGLFAVWRIVTVTLRPGQPVAGPPGLGAFSVDRPTGLLFGIPDVAGDGFKAGIDAGVTWDPAQPPAPPTAAEVGELTGLMTSHVPGVDPDVVDAVSCLYTMTADRRFVVGALPWAPAVVVAAACSGHGFKFGPAIGEAVADLCLGLPRTDLEFIGTARREPPRPPGAPVSGPPP